MGKGFVAVVLVLVSVAVVEAIAVGVFGAESVGRDGIHFITTVVLFALTIDKIDELKGGDDEQR